MTQGVAERTRNGFAENGSVAVTLPDSPLGAISAGAVDGGGGRPSGSWIRRLDLQHNGLRLQCYFLRRGGDSRAVRDVHAQDNHIGEAHTKVHGAILRYAGK